MSTTVAIHQPQFMPWLGYFDKMDRADCFILLDTVQYKKNEWQNRNRIKTAQGPQWLTVPVTYRFPARIADVAVNDGANWRHKHWQALITNYARADHWSDHERDLEALYERDWERLVDVSGASIEWLRRALGIDTPVRWASDLEADEEPTQRLIDLCHAVGADVYLAGADGRQYMDLERFTGAGIEVTFQHYRHPSYDQLFGPFETHMSALDLTLNCGPDSLEILRQGRGQTTDEDDEVTSMEYGE